MTSSLAGCADDRLAALAPHEHHFTLLPSGRLRCILTGHDVFPSLEQVGAYVSSKQFVASLGQSALDLSLKKFEPHVVPSPHSKDRLLCTLTGKTINKSEDAVWKHMMGHKFQKCLAKKETEVAQRKAGRQQQGSEQQAQEDEGTAAEVDGAPRHGGGHQGMEMEDACEGEGPRGTSAAGCHPVSAQRCASGSGEVGPCSGMDAIMSADGEGSPVRAGEAAEEGDDDDSPGGSSGTSSELGKRPSGCGHAPQALRPRKKKLRPVSRQ